MKTHHWYIVASLLLLATFSIFIILSVIPVHATHAASPSATTDMATVKARLQRGDAFVLIDVREPSEWNRGYIKGAILIPRGLIASEITKKVPNKNTPIVLYCSSGRRSAMAATTLRHMGYRNVTSMSAGYQAWQRAGY